MDEFDFSRKTQRDDTTHSDVLVRLELLLTYVEKAQREDIHLMGGVVRDELIALTRPIVRNRRNPVPEPSRALQIGMDPAAVAEVRDLVEIATNTAVPDQTKAAWLVRLAISKWSAMKGTGH